MLPKYPNFALNFLNLPKISARNIDSQELPELLNHQIHNHHQNSLIHKNRQINQKQRNPQMQQILRNHKNNKICQTQLIYQNHGIKGVGQKKTGKHGKSSRTWGEGV